MTAGASCQAAALHRPMVSVDPNAAIAHRGRAGVTVFAGACASRCGGGFFDNSVDCIRQPIRDEISSKSSREMTLEGSRRASGQSRSSFGLGGPQIVAAGWLARTGTRFLWLGRLYLARFRDARESGSGIV